MIGLVLLMLLVSNLHGKFSLMVLIIPSEGSMCVYRELIMAITTMSQLDGLAG